MGLESRQKLDSKAHVCNHYGILYSGESEVKEKTPSQSICHEEIGRHWIDLCSESVPKSNHKTRYLWRPSSLPSSEVGVIQYFPMPFFHLAIVDLPMYSLLWWSCSWITTSYNVVVILDPGLFPLLLQVPTQITATLCSASSVRAFGDFTFHKEIPEKP